MQAKVKKWGNSASVRIPASVMESAKLYINDRVDIREEGGRIVIEPLRENTLDSMIAAITVENLHGDADFGALQGQELL